MNNKPKPTDSKSLENLEITVDHKTIPPHAPMEETRDLPAQEIGEPTEIAGPQIKSVSVDQVGLDATVDFDRTQGFEFDSTKEVRRFEVPGYALMSELGRGGMGVVYKARQERADRIVALKAMINVDQARTEDIERFTIEAKASARLHHPNIIQVYEVGQSGNSPYFTQEFASGGTLSRKIAKQMLTADDTAKMMLAIANAVAYAHSKGIVHRDLKPLNILLDENGNPKIADFGLARRMEDQSHLTQDGTILGTPSYMAPEQASGTSNAIGPRSDVYALGAILYELLTGRPPFKGANVWEVVHQVRNAEPVPPSQLQAGVPVDLETICLKCLQKSPDKRYDSAQHLADDLQRHIRNEPILARPIGQWERIVRLCKRNPREARLVGLVASLLLLFSMGAAWTAFRINQDRNHISQQNVKIIEQSKDIEHQRDEIAKEKQVSDERLVLYRDTVSKLVNRAPRILEDAPIGDGTRRELGELIQGILESSSDSGEVGSSKKWALMATKLREGEIDRENAFKFNDLVAREKSLRSASEQFEEALRLAKEVYESDEKNRGKAASNYQIALVRNAQLRYLNLPKSQWTQVVPLFKQSIELAREAINYAQNEEPSELAKYQSGLGNLLNSYVEFLMKMRPDSEQFRQGSQNYLAEAEALFRQVLDAKDISIDLIEDSLFRLGFCKESQAKLLEMRGDNNAVVSARSESIAQYRRLVESKPFRFAYLSRLAVECNELGDFLLTRNGNVDEVLRYYKEALSCYQTIEKGARVSDLEQNKFAMQYYRLGLALKRKSDLDLSDKFFEHAYAIRRKGQADEEDHSNGVQTYSVIVRRAEALLCQGRLGQKTGFIEEINELAQNATKLVSAESESQKIDIHRAIAAASGLLAQRLLHAKDGESSKYREFAEQTLERAIHEGFRDLSYIQTDPDFEWVSEFGLLSEVEEAIKKESAKQSQSSANSPSESK